MLSLYVQNHLAMTLPQLQANSSSVTASGGVRLGKADPPYSGTLPGTMIFHAFSREYFGAPNFAYSCCIGFDEATLAFIRVRVVVLWCVACWQRCICCFFLQVGSVAVFGAYLSASLSD